MSQREHVAVLECGIQLVYDFVHVVPAVGELVSCRRHGYCVVGGTWVQNKRHTKSGRAPQRAPEELITYLSTHRQCTVHSLRRQGFTLRLIHIVHRAGLLTYGEGMVFWGAAR